MTIPYGSSYGFGLYIHWPYCSKICPYCDFNVYAAKSSRDFSSLVDSIIADIRHHHDLLPEHPPLKSVYFGGGTPSLMAASDIGKILESVNNTFGIEQNAEITLEANPNDVNRNDITSWLSLGVSRLSIGLQSLDDTSLQFLGRDHTSGAGRTAIEKAKLVFKKVSVDLIYALPEQSLQSWEQELNQVLQFGVNHLSLYELTFEERTAFGKRLERGEIVQPKEDLRADFYQLTDDVTRKAGMPSYEISNYATNESSRSEHNTIYWRGGDWIGVGPGAHGRITRGSTRYATEKARKPAEYVALVGSRTDQLSDIEILDCKDVAKELLMLGLRLEEGIEVDRLEKAGLVLDQDIVLDFTKEELVKVTRNRIHLTNKGKLLADAIGASLAG